jgi:branched-chain amino acid transport system substrate-binding protein
MDGEKAHTRRDHLKLLGTVSVVGSTALTGYTQEDAIPMGSLVPITGAASALGPGHQAAVNIAVEDVNAAGGPLGREIQMINEDSETKPSRAVTKLRRLIDQENVVGFVGPYSSGVGTTLAPVARDNRVMEVSHGNTSPVLADMGYRDDVKYYGRTSPNDAQQGIMMARGLEDQVGAETAAFLHVDNPYGAGLAEKASEAFGGETTAIVGYSKQTSDYTSTLDQVYADDPDAVGLVSYPDNGRTILEQWFRGGYGGTMVMGEGMNEPGLLQDLSDIVEGMYITTPQPEETEGFQTFEQKMQEQDAENTVFSPNAYDALFLEALAMHQAGEASGAAIAQNIRSVSRPGGETVTVDEFQKAKGLLDDGQEINYEGASGPADLNEKLEPISRFALLEVGSGGQTEVAEVVEAEFFEGKLYADEGTEETTTV